MNKFVKYITQFSRGLWSGQFALAANLSCALACATLLASSAIAVAKPTGLQALLPQACNLAGVFTQSKKLPDINQTLQSSGNFIFSCGQGLIWSTREPQQETLIYRRDNKHYVLLPENDASPLKGRIHRELGNILNNLIGADIDYLHTHFDESANGEGYTLTPKNKRLRKYIANIAIQPLAAGADKHGVNITIHHSEQENTQIAIEQTHIFDEFSRALCDQFNSDAIAACALLYD